MRERVAIIGGGMGGLSAAYALSKPEIADKYDITVFQMGWRLGGKCATGRGPFGRIEEHGIHGFLGAYYNTLEMMYDVYEKWTPNANCPIPDFNSAFVKINTGLQWERHAGHIKRWYRWTPPSPLKISDIRKQSNLLVLWLVVYSTVIRRKIDSMPLGKSAGHQFGNILQLLEAFENQGLELAQNDGFVPLSLKKTPPANPIWQSMNDVIDFDLTRTTSSRDDTRRNILEIEMFQVILRGIRDEEIFTNGFLSIDDVNFSQWLKRNRASSALLESPLVSYIVNLTFQFPNGDITKEPNMSAASYIQWALRSATYIDRSLYLFAAGTGETIITPLYRLLKERGVTFKFFHELIDIDTNKSGTSVSSIIFQKQANLKGPDYDPTVEIKNLLCWPDRPKYNLLENHPGIQDVDFEKPKSASFGKTLKIKIGSDADAKFEKVILAIPPEAIKSSANSLLQKNAIWNAKLNNMPTTSTQAMQIWLNHSVEDLAEMPKSFYYGSANFMGEMHGELDFTKYIQFENWGNKPPKGLLYGCGVMVDPPALEGVPDKKVAKIRAFETTRTMLTTVGADLLPLSRQQLPITTNPHSMDFDDLYVHDSDPISSKSGQPRLRAQYFRGNIFPSERYTQSPIKTRENRINPLKPGLDNMTGAGDWVDTVLNVGSVECSVMGGFFAAAYINDLNDALNVIGAWVTPKDSLI